MSTYYSGKSGSLTFPGIAGTIACKNWSYKIEQELVDVSNKTSGGYHETIAGLQKLTGSADLVYDGTHVSVGTSGDFSFIFPDTSTTTGTCWVTNVDYESDVAGAVTMKVDLEATGSYSQGGS